MKQSFRSSNNFWSIARDIRFFLRKHIKIEQLSTSVKNAHTPNQTKTNSSFIGNKLVIYGLAENIQDDQLEQIGRDRNSLLQMFRDRRELEENIVSDCFRLGTEQP